MAAGNFLFGGEAKPGYLTAPVSRADIETTVLATGTVKAETWSV